MTEKGGNPSVPLYPNEKDLKTFEITVSGILMVTHPEIIHWIILWLIEERRERDRDTEKETEIRHWYQDFSYTCIGHSLSPLWARQVILEFFSHTRTFVLQRAFFWSLLRRVSRKKILCSRNPLPQGECATLNPRMYEKYDDQESPLLGTSVIGPSFLWWDHTRRSFFEESRASVSGHHGRMGETLDLGDTSGKFRWTSRPDECNVRVSPDRDRPWRHPESFLIIFLGNTIPLSKVSSQTLLRKRENCTVCISRHYRSCSSVSQTPLFILFIIMNNW